MGPHVMVALTDRPEVQLAPEDVAQALSEADDSVVLLSHSPSSVRRWAASAQLRLADAERSLYRLSLSAGCGPPCRVQA